MIRVLLAFLLLIPLAAQAVIETYEFSNDANRERFRLLNEELRCPKCQNQNLADSNSPIAADLRAEVYRMLEEGNSDPEIVDYLVDRYGEFVRYRPKIDSETYVLWFLPISLLLVGAGVVIFISRRGTRPEDEPAAVDTLTDAEQARLDALLGQSGGTDSKKKTPQ